MSTEARRASVPPRPDVPPQPAVPPRPATPPRPSRPPADPVDPKPTDPADPTYGASTRQAPAEPPEREPAHRATPGAQPSRPDRRDAREMTSGAAEPRVGRPTGSAGAAGARTASRDPGTAGDGSPAPDPGSPLSRTAPRFGGPRAQHSDAMTPPPPPASARFPDIPPQPARPARSPRGEDTGTPARAEERPAPRPAPPHDFRRAPRPTGPAPRPAAAEPSRPTAPGGTTPPPAPPAPRTTGAFAPENPPPTGAAAPRSAGPESTRPTGPAGARPADPEGSRPAGPGAYGADAADERPAADGFFSAGAGARTGAGTRPVAPPPPSRPDVPSPPSRPAGPVDAPGSERGWSPLPRGWVPAPGRSRRETEPDGAGGGPRGESRSVVDDGPAWSPGATVRQPGFAVPPVPAAPPVPENPQRTEGAASGPDPSLSWSAPMTPGGTLGSTRPVVTFARPEGYRDTLRLFGRRGRVAAAAACVVLGMGLIGGAVTGSWLVGDSADAAEHSAYATAGGLWHNVPVDRLFPPTVDGQGAGPGGADRTWTRIAVAPDGDCAGALDPLLLKVLAPVGCERLLRATYTDATQSYVTTVGLLFTTADEAAMRSLDTRFTREKLAERTDLMPRPYAAKGTVAAAFGDKQRAAWTVSVLTDAPVVVYSVSGWADGRVVDTPQPAAAATAAGATTAPAQAGLGNEAQGLADRVERGLRKTAVTSSEQPS
ncbi:hypothetical protein [Streptomyces maremycinicus]|uniref:hypothetical protein n=1 Tax=Streptomyces maremycinicus TaxID=1679753 RepID=UPI000AC0C582|nr:hypothetical protein [Streptomyces sp. NBRC 110468]